MNKLPHELYRPVFEAVRRKRDLCVLARCSRAMQPEAERLIYRSLVASTDRDIRGAYDRICAMPRVRQYVERLRIDFERPSETGDGTTFQVFFRPLSYMLEVLENLLHLAITVPYGTRTDQPHCGNLFDGCKFRLDSLRSPFALDQQMMAFLSRQSTIRELWMDRATLHMVQLPVELLLPRLVVLRAPSGIMASTVFTNRSVTHLNLQQTFTATAETAIWSVIALRIKYMDESLPLMVPNVQIITGVSLSSCKPVCYRFICTDLIIELICLKGPTWATVTGLVIVPCCLPPSSQARNIQPLGRTCSNTAGHSLRISKGLSLPA
jgi:hypothetical protein